MLTSSSCSSIWAPHYAGSRPLAKGVVTHASGASALEAAAPGTPAAPAHATKEACKPHWSATLSCASQRV